MFWSIYIVIRYIDAMNAYTHREQLKGWLELLVLAVLHHESTCGYRLRKRIIEKSGDQFATVFGRLYPLLKDLEQAGLLKSRLETGQPRSRRIYSMTARGEERLKMLKKNWKHFSEAMTWIVTH